MEIKFENNYKSSKNKIFRYKFKKIFTGSVCWKQLNANERNQIILKWVERHTVFMDWRSHSNEYRLSPNCSNFNDLPIKIPAGVFIDSGKPTLKMYIER